MSLIVFTICLVFIAIVIGVTIIQNFSLADPFNVIFSLVIGVVLVEFFVIMIIFKSNEEKIVLDTDVIETTYVYSIGSDNIINGSWGLFSGSIDEVPSYIFFVDSDGYLKQEHIPSEGVRIIRSDSETPRFETIKTKYRYSKWFLYCNASEKVVYLYVPEDAVIQKYQLN